MEAGWHATTPVGGLGGELCDLLTQRCPARSRAIRTVQASPNRGVSPEHKDKIMERRKALVVAGTLTASMAMAGGALAANMGLLGSAGADVGKLDANSVSDLQGPVTTLGPDVTVIVQDIPAAASTAGSTSGSYVAPAPAPAPAVGAPSGGSLDYDDDHAEDTEDDHSEDEDLEDLEDHEEHETEDDD
jgi:hypothetical protein